MSKDIVVNNRTGKARSEHSAGQKRSPDYLEGCAGLQVLVRNGRWPCSGPPAIRLRLPGGADQAVRAFGRLHKKAPAMARRGKTMLAMRRMSQRRGFSLRESARRAS